MELDLGIDGSAPFPRKLAKDVWLLGNFYFNLFLIKGTTSSVLIELGVSGITDRVIQQLDSLGVTPEYLVMTHPHADHLTGLPGLLEKFPDAILISGQGAREFIEHPKALPTFIKEDAFISQALRSKGIEPGRNPITALDFPENNITVSEDMSLDLGGLTLNCSLSAGHSPGSIMIHVPEVKMVVASDSLGFHFTGKRFLPLFFTGYQAFKNTLEKIEALNPDILGIGHQGPFTGSNAKKAISSSSQKALELFSRISNDHREAEVITADLFEANYIDEFTLYTPDNIKNCCQLLVKRVRE